METVPILEKHVSKSNGNGFHFGNCFQIQWKPLLLFWILQRSIQNGIVTAFSGEEYVVRPSFRDPWTHQITGVGGGPDGILFFFLKSRALTSIYWECVSPSVPRFSYWAKLGINRMAMTRRRVESRNQTARLIIILVIVADHRHRCCLAHSGALSCIYSGQPDSASTQKKYLGRLFESYRKD